MELSLHCRLKARAQLRAAIKNGGKQEAMQRVNDKWVPLTSLVKELPKDVVFNRVLQRASNEKLLDYGTTSNGARYFVLTPLPKS
jgi:hypothetical protein